MIQYKAFYLLPSNYIYEIEYYTDRLEKIKELILDENLIGLKLKNCFEKGTNNPIFFLDNEIFFSLGFDRGFSIMKERHNSKVISIYEN